MASEANATLVERVDLTPAIARLRIRPDAGPPMFRSGQYLAIGLPVDGRLVQRPYSVASPPDERDELEFLVRLVPDGLLTPHLWRLRPGDRVRIGSPKGLFTLDEGDPRRHLFLATGTGIAPLRSMLAALLERGPSTTIGTGRDQAPIVVHGVATSPELAYRDELERLSRDARIVYQPAISRPSDPANGSWQGETGRLDGLVARIVADAGVESTSAVAYVCGNPAMIEAVGSRLANLGFPTEAIRAEHYWTIRPTVG